MRRLDTHYARGWEQIARLVRDEGKSFSGRERNCCFVNTGGSRFAQASAATGLDLIDDARASAVVDWDLDGDLDLWVTNRTGPRVRYLQNASGNEAHFVGFQLVGSTCNRDAIGARLEISLRGDERRHIRTLHAGDGFLSQSSKIVHFGLGDAVSVELLRVRWPDGQTQEFSNLEANAYYQLTQGGSLKPLARRGTVTLEAHPISEPPVTDATRIVFQQPHVLPVLEIESLSGSPSPLSKMVGSQPFLLNLWQHTCLPCLQELRDFSRAEAEIRQHGLGLIALHVGSLSTGASADRAVVLSALKRIDYDFSAALLADKAVDQLDQFQRQILQRHRGIVFPTSLLVDSDGTVVALYKGPLSVEQLLEDVALLGKGDQRSLAALPFSGKWAK